MSRTLHITNGDSVSLGETGLGGQVLAWKDVLHEGPVPSGLSLDEMRPVRARFLAELSGQAEARILTDLERRDQVLAGFRQSDEVVLWFEHDLFDQLQLIQILDWFAKSDERSLNLCLIDSERYLGPMPPEELATLFPSRARVTRAQLDLASRAWTAFSSSDPRLLARLLRSDTSALPHLAGAIDRHLQQFPSVENGLCRTERQILEIVASGVTGLRAVFCADRDREDRIFMGDLVFNSYVESLAAARLPLLRFVGGRGSSENVEITPEGEAVMRCRADHLELNGIDRWRGGVHLHADKAWRRNQSLAGHGPASGREVWRWSSRDRAFVN